VKAVLSLEAVTIRLGGRTVLEDVTLDISPGEIVALLGPSGAGKSTLLRVILGLERPAAGRVLIAGALATDGPNLVCAPAERGVSMVFQDLALWPHLDVAGHLRFVLESRRVPRDQHGPRIEGLLERLALSDKARRLPGTLSGGERQRVAIARALVSTPVLLLLDEPLANVDVALKQDMLVLFRELLRERNTPALYVTHDPREAARLASRAVVLEGGVLVQQGSWDVLRAAPATAFVERLASELDSRF